MTGGTDDVALRVEKGREDIPRCLHTGCDGCIKHARSKYTNFMSDNGTFYEDGFGVNCNFIPHNEKYVDVRLQSQLTPEDFDQVNAYRSALLWGEKYLIDPDNGQPWRAWPFQRPPLLCKSPRKVYRFGRRCLVGNTKILLSSGKEKEIKDIRAGEYIKSLDLLSEQNVSRRILNFWENGFKDTFKITLVNELSVTCTSNHPFLTYKKEWKSIEEGLQVGSKIFVYGNRPSVSEIKSIIPAGKNLTYDIEVEDTHNLVSNGIYSHNTGKTTILAVEILWYLFTAGGGEVRDPITKKIRTNLKVLLLAPQKSHVENIFDRIRAFLAVSPALGPCIDRNKRGSPQKITLVTESGISEGNALSGFASGDSSGSKGLSARGQDADLIILDEGAFISSEAIEGVVLAILYTRPTTKFIISSTPSGIANDYFEGICTKRPDFAEFYVPATQRPDWAQVAEQMLREFGSNQEQYDKEVLAAFSPAGIGVYREDLVRLAQTDFEYGQMRHSSAFVYTMGVDWNKEHGTEIVVIGTQRAEPHISYIVCSENIPKKEHTSPRGISRIVELNQIWQPSWIYVDAGGGDGGQMLRYHGRSMVARNIIEARLKDIVKDFDFGSKIEITEHDGTRNKVPSKPFMVENSVKKFELGEVKFPRSDLNIMRQLNNYIVARRTPSGTPVFGSKEPKWGDHTLDALNLALVAIRLEFPSFQHAGIAPLGVPIAFIPNNQEEVRPRIILPAAANSVSRSSGRIIKPEVEATAMVKYWGVEPTEDGVIKNFRRRGVRKRKLRYGR
jgi:replicative DNA helicase